MTELTLDAPAEGGWHAHIENSLILGNVERKKARLLTVPTGGGEIKAGLSEIGEPITKFGDRVRISLSYTRLLFLGSYLKGFHHFLSCAHGASQPSRQNLGGVFVRTNPR